MKCEQCKMGAHLGWGPCAYHYEMYGAPTPQQQVRRTRAWRFGYRIGRRLGALIAVALDRVVTDSQRDRIRRALTPDGDL